MKLFGAFREFAKRVIAAVKKGGLPRIDQIKLDHLLTRTGKRNLILSRAILTALDAGGASKKDIAKFGRLLETANQRILADKPPFTKKESSELAAIFRRASLSRKAVHKFQGDINELLAEQIGETIEGKRLAGVPKKRAIELKKKERKVLKA